MWTKADIINFAFRKAGIANQSINLAASPDMTSDALADYEALVYEYSQQINIRPYVSNPPDINDYSGLSDLAAQAMGYQLALRMCPDYLVEPSPRLESAAAETLQNLRVAMVDVPQLERRDDMPVGQGWKMRHGYGQFYNQANIIAGSIEMAVNDVSTYTVNFDEGQLLQYESLQGFQVKHSEYAEVTNASYDGNIVTYTVKFTQSGRGWVSIIGAGDQSTVATIRTNFDVRVDD